MKVICNSKNIPVRDVLVKVNLKKIAREFIISNTEDKKSITIDDELKIYDDSGTLLIEGVVESVLYKDKIWLYTGRSNSKYIVDAYIEKTTEFNKVTDFSKFLKDILSGYELDVKGNFGLIGKDYETVFLGDRLLEVVTDKIKKNGIDLISDASGNIEIYKKTNEVEDKYFSTGKNIISSQYVEDKSDIYDKYTVVSQGKFKLDEKLETGIQGSVGSGKKVRVDFAENLTEDQCKEVAESNKEKDIRKSFVYEMTIEATEEVKIGNVYNVDDTTAGIKEALRVIGCEYRSGVTTDLIVVSMGRI